MKKFNLFLLLAALLMVGCSDSYELDYLGYNPGGASSGPVIDTSDPNNFPVLGETEDPATLPLISTNPAFFSDTSEANIVIRVNTTGTDWENHEGDMYAHAGVVTDKSDGGWVYVQSDWGENKPELQLHRYEETQIWYMIITGGPRAFYEVPDDEKILKLAFVFRTGDCSKELKDNGADIFYELTEGTLDVKFNSPKGGEIWEIGQTYTVKAVANGATEFKLYMGEEVVAENTTGAELSYEYTATEPVDLAFKAVAGNGAKTVEKSAVVAVLGETEQASRPAEAKEGVTFDGDNTATFVLWAPGKKSVVVMGDFNNYTPTNATMMKQDGDYFWVSVSGLEKNKTYGYQYLVDGKIKVGDPYSELILDPNNDKHISPTVYPNMPVYPSEYATDIVTLFSTSEKKPYNWTVTNFERPEKNRLAIYELLIRDFTEEGSIDAVTARLDYLQELGINAIELMPIQEFDDNDSWGYNPCFYFAPDKAYGSADAYKRFIDECHARGIAVILDVVFNHATGQFPWAKMWWNSSENKTAAENPLFNVDAPHNFSVYHDLRHDVAKTREYFKEVLTYWLEEYNVDGFRFDLVKGFVQNNANDYDCNNYSAERVGFMSEYAQAIRDVEPDAYIIFEHLGSDQEQDEYYTNFGVLGWNKMMGPYEQTVMGWENGNISGFKKGRVNNIEDHDEERNAFKAMKWGQDYVKDWAVLSKRLQAVYAYHCLIPYATMIWQFGELGYDYSLNANQDGFLGDGDQFKLSRKPIRWDFYNDADRRAIYETISKVLAFRQGSNTYVADNATVHTHKVGDADAAGKVFILDDAIWVANFTNEPSKTTISVPSAGQWTNLLTNETVTLGSTYEVELEGNDFIVLVK